MLLCAAGCTGSSAHSTERREDPAAEAPLQAAPRDEAFATPEMVGGFCTDGVGVFLTAVDDAAELTLYVVAPAERATFSRPALHLTTLDGEHSQTEVVEFEDVTLEAGESHVLRQEAVGTLMEVFAEFADENE
ncbi:MAG TPA: hypothetical protein VJV78_06275 [Polyangiales bacterium]|nr:hypothetical protein [Polyangiales bacterium]